MAELSTDDVAAFTGDRLGDDDETQRMLDAALMVARREVGWHVSPVLEGDVVTLDGPDSRVLWLPTMKLVELTSVEEDDTVLDVADVRASSGDTPARPARVALRKRSKGFWTDEYGAIVVTMDHGFTEEQAADWRQAVLSMVDQMSLLPVQSATGSSDFGATTKRIDDVAMTWGNPYAAMAEEVLFSMGSILSRYRLPDLEFL